MKLLISVLTISTLASGCAVDSPFIHDPYMQQPIERVQQPAQPIIINQMPGQPYAIQPQLVKRMPNGMLVTTQAPMNQSIGAPLSLDEKTDQGQVRILMQQAAKLRDTPINSMTISMIQQAHKVERDLGRLHAKYAKTDRGPTFLYESEQQVSEGLLENGQVRFLTQDELNYLMLGVEQ